MQKLLIWNQTCYNCTTRPTVIKKFPKLIQILGYQEQKTVIATSVCDYGAAIVRYADIEPMKV